MLKKIALFCVLGLLTSAPATATVAVNSGPTSLVADPLPVKADSSPIGLFALSLSQDGGETLSSIGIVVNNTASSTASGTDFGAVSVYKDNGDGNFDPSADLLAGSQTTVNIGSVTTVSATSNNTLTSGKFFVSLGTSASWSDAAPGDSVTVTFPTDAVVTSANSPALTAVTTNTLTADTTAPSLVSAIAKNTGGTAAKETGDSVELTFSEATKKPAINVGNVNSVFPLNNGHSWLDSDGALGAAAWSVNGMILTVSLATSTASNTLPTVQSGDTVTVSGAVVLDLAGNLASGSRIITGNFAGETEDENDEEGGDNKKKCNNSLINGRLYKVKDNPTVYLAAGCRLKPFRGAAVFHARGHKFQNIIELDSLEGFAVRQKPVLPTGGTLIKGSNATVWFVTFDGKRRGFKTAAKFFALGFAFGQIQQISDEDLGLIVIAPPIDEQEDHPDGSLVKCGNSAIVFQVIGNSKFPFRSADAFLARGHSWDHIAIVDCGRLRYILGAPVE